jgi:hypothetical protein
MGKLPRESRLTPTHHDLQDVIVNVLATDQVERFTPKSPSSRSYASRPQAALYQSAIPEPSPHASVAPRVSVAPSTSVAPRASVAPRVSIASTKQETQSCPPLQSKGIEPMHATYDHVRVQIQRMYVHRQRIGFCLRAALSMVLLFVLGFVCYYLIANTSRIELSHFF